MPKEPSCQETVATSLDSRSNIFKNQSLLHLPTQPVKKGLFFGYGWGPSTATVINTPAGSPLLAHLPRVIDVTNLIMLTISLT